MKKIFTAILNHPLNCRTKLIALWRFVRWQLCSRLMGGSWVLPWVNDSKIIIANGDHGLTPNIYCGLQEFSEMSFCLHFLIQDDLFFDIGANSGSYTVLASAVRRARTIAFEPVNTSFERMTANIKINSIEKLVMANNIGLGESESLMMFSNNRNCMNQVVMESSSKENVQEQKIARADSFFEKGIPVLLKIDVDGFEKFVLLGAEKIISSNECKAVVIELNGSGRQYGIEDEEIEKILTEKGFECFSYNPFSRAVFPLDKNSGNDNRIFIRDLEFVKRRLQEADPFQILGQRI